MKPVSFFLFLMMMLCFNVLLMAQDIHTTDTISASPTCLLCEDLIEENTKHDTQRIPCKCRDGEFEKLPEMPSYPGGMEALMSFFKQNLRYPRQAKRAGIEGTVYVQFMVGEDGKLSAAKILKGVDNCPDCDREALRLVGKMPAWIPGKKDGKEAAVRYTLPVKFKLPSQNKTL